MGPLRFSVVLLSVWALLGAVLLPHRMTLTVQAGLVMLAVVQTRDGGFLVNSSVPVAAIILLHLLASIVTSWGCYGDAMMLAPSAERLPEFLLSVQAGALVFGLVYQYVPALLIPHSWGVIEYPVALLLCLALRAWGKFVPEQVLR